MPPKPSPKSRVTKKSVTKITKVTKRSNDNLAIDMNTQDSNTLPVLKTVKSIVDGKTICPFYTARYPLSNFYSCEFTVNGNTFYSSEQYFMYRKAAQFHDFSARQELLTETDPKKAKMIGRRVQGFDKAVWDRVSYDVMVEVLTVKFEQNPRLKDYLLATGDAVLVEAAPKDRLWGIGMGENNLDVENPKKWLGRNLLGKALMQVRDQLK